MIKLSIIMPCYNCETTLEEAVESVYTQNLSIAFEVVMVDDGSSDGTRELIKCLADKYKEIKYIFHEQNRGGGAARNTAVENSSSNVIFCLDSDDILPDKMLPKMLKCLDEKKCDGVVIGKSVFFIDDVEDIRNEVSYEERKLKFEDLFSNTPTSVTGNFLYKRSAFDKVGGYPIMHGFDTQGYGFRILANNLNIQVCKEAYYYQRIPRSKSYYIRELEAGNISKNWFYILSENLYKFSDEIKELILNYDYRNYDNNTGLKNIMTVINNSQNIFNENMLAIDCEEAYKKLNSSNNTFDLYWCGVYSLNKKNLNNANLYFQKAQRLGLNNWSMYHYLLSSMYEVKLDINFNELFDNIKYFSPQKRDKIENIIRFLYRVRNKLIRILKG